MPTSPVCKAAAAERLDAPWGSLRWLASSKIGNSSTMTFGRATLPAGGGNPMHRHPNCDEILHVLSGKIEHSIEDQRYILEVGDTISIPTGLWHNATVLSETDAELVICFSSADRETEFAHE